DSLPKNQKVAFILHKHEGLSYKEISKILEISLSSVEARIHRAKINLQKKLIPYLKKI
ncbi:RNA polymerase sigma factor, partial [bacterium]|nr:RNA polymerase sigma factor [bacterium]